MVRIFLQGKNDERKSEGKNDERKREGKNDERKRDEKVYEVLRLS